MRYGIIRGLWGDILHQRHETRPPKAYYTVLQEVKRSAAANETTDRVYCWGTQNYEYCKWLGLPAVKLGDCPYSIPCVEKERGPKYGGMVVWGVNHAYQKWGILLRALDEFDAVVFVDWDMRQVQPIPAGFWEQQQTGAPIRTPLIVQKNTTWGARWGRAKDKQLLPYGGCVWYGDRSFIEDCLREHDEKPSYMQQQILGKIVDKRNGDRWIGADGWEQLGYKAEFVSVGNQLQTPAEDQVIWRVGRRNK